MNDDDEKQFHVFGMQHAMLTYRISTSTSYTQRMKVEQHLFVDVEDQSKQRWPEDLREIQNGQAVLQQTYSQAERLDNASMKLPDKYTVEEGVRAVFVRAGDGREMKEGERGKERWMMEK